MNDLLNDSGLRRVVFCLEYLAPVVRCPLLRRYLLLLLRRYVVFERGTQAIRKQMELYRVLGAVPYLARLNETTGSPPSGSLVELDVLSALSDRERDVATLLISGLTYAQIARDLFVTRATVGFHTGRIYAKTGVTSRAELIDLVRTGTPERQN